MKLLFSDDFTGNILKSQWLYNYWWCSDEAPYHPQDTDTWFNKEDVIVDNGLILQAHYNPKSFGEPPNVVTPEYSVGVIYYKDLLYGDLRIDVEAMLPMEGSWSAIWTYGVGTEPTEIDFMEQIRGKTTHFQTNFHISKPKFLWFGELEREQHQKDHFKGNLSEDYNTFSLDFKRNKRATCLFNDEVIHEIKGLKAVYLTEPFFFILNNGLAGLPQNVISQFRVKKVSIYY